MTALMTAAILLSSPVGEPSALIPGFISALSSGDGEMALEMISPEAIRIIDSLMVHDPERIPAALALFGLQGLVSDSTDDGTDLLLDIFEAPYVPMMLAVVTITPEEPFQHMERIFIPVTWSVFSERNTVFIETAPTDGGDGDWRILDFFTTDPRDLRPGSRSTRSACSPG